MKICPEYERHFTKILRSKLIDLLVEFGVDPSMKLISFLLSLSESCNTAFRKLIVRTSSSPNKILNVLSKRKLRTVALKGMIEATVGREFTIWFRLLFSLSALAGNPFWDSISCEETLLPKVLLGHEFTEEVTRENVRFRREDASF